MACASFSSATGGSIVTGPSYRQLIPGGLANHSVRAQVGVDKYGNHLPLDRQCKRFARPGVHLPSSTIGAWPKAVAQALEPLYERLKPPVLESGDLLAPYPVLHLEKTDPKDCQQVNAYGGCSPATVDLKPKTARLSVQLLPSAGLLCAACVCGLRCRRIGVP